MKSIASDTIGIADADGLSDNPSKCEHGQMITSSAEIPLVSIAIPTFNRRRSLEKSIESALAQDYPNVEIIISDNASSDDTNAFCEHLCAKYPKIRYIRNTVNKGSTNNFIKALNEAKGEFFMWLADDDWIDDNYVNTCMATLQEDDTCVLAGGLTKFYQNDNFVGLGKFVQLTQRNGYHRILRYLLLIVNNGVYYGLMRRPLAIDGSLRNCIGSDLIFVASLARLGSIKTTTSTSIHRTKGGASLSYKAAADALSLPKIHAYFPYLSMAINQVADILSDKSSYRNDSYSNRLLLATSAFVIITGFRASRYYARLLVKTILVASKLRQSD